MRNTLLICFSLCMAGCQVNAKEKEIIKEYIEETTTSAKDQDINLSIRQITDKYYKNKNFYIGSAAHQQQFGEISTEILDREFGYVTPANDFKQTYIHPTFSSWRWDRPDAWVTHSKESNQVLRLHSPISPQCSKWAKEDDRTADEMSKMLDEYMIALCNRYGNEPSIKWMDVVNETICTVDIKDPLGNHTAGEWFSPRQGTDKWENPWTVIGFDESTALRVPLYISRAFELAQQYAPNVKKIINQHGDFEEVVWEKMKKLVNYLRNEKGLKVDGLGWQAHIDLGWEKVPGNIQRLSAFIDWCHANRLEFHVTEMNVWLKDENSNKEIEQAETFRAVTEVLLSKIKTGVVGLNFWNIRDEDTANPEWKGTIWNNDGKPKPAYLEIKKALLKHASN